MKKITLLLILFGVALLLAACASETSDTSTDIEESNAGSEISLSLAEDTAVQTTNTGAGLTQNYEGALTIQGQLALGTVQLEETNLAVDEAQAADLLPLWQALQTLSQSDTTAEAELQAVVNQIESTLTTEQVNAIAAMQLTEASMTELAAGGEFAQGRGFGGGDGVQRGAGQGQGGPGGFGGGGLPGGGPGGGGFPGGGPGAGGAEGGTLSEDDIATRQAQFEQNGPNQLQNRLLTSVVTRLLEDKLGIVSENAARAEVMDAAFTAVAEATGLSVEELRTQTAEGQTLAQIVEANNGDIEALQTTLVEIFSSLPNANDLDLEQSARDWLGRE